MGSESYPFVFLNGDRGRRNRTPRFCLVIKKGKRGRSKIKCWQIFRISASVGTNALVKNDKNGTGFQDGFFSEGNLSVYEIYPAD